jgi:hypothetical protein
MVAAMSDSNRKPRFILGLLGAVLGGVIGYFAFRWMARQGFYAIILPAGLLGLVGGYAVRERSVPFAIACGFAGLVLGLWAEWNFAPFIADDSFVYFITHVHLLKQIKVLMLAASPFISFWLALGFDRKQIAPETSKSN